MVFIGLAASCSSVWRKSPLPPAEPPTNRQGKRPDSYSASMKKDPRRTGRRTARRPGYRGDRWACAPAGAERLGQGGEALLHAGRGPPRRMSSLSSGTCTTSAEAITEASKNCSTSRSQAPSAAQYRRCSLPQSSPEVLHRLMDGRGKRARSCRAMASRSRCGETKPAI